MNLIPSYIKDHPVHTFLLAGVGFVVWIGIFNLAFAGRALPSVYVNGVAVGGMSKSEAKKAVAKQAQIYRDEQVAIEYQGSTLRIPVSRLGVVYDDSALDNALAYGRRGNIVQQWYGSLRAFFGRPTNMLAVRYDDAKLLPYLLQIGDDVTKPVANATLNFAEGQVGATPAQPGRRFDAGTFVLMLKDRLGTMSGRTIQAPVYSLLPAIDEQSLAAAKSQADTFTASPLTLKVSGTTKNVDVPTIVSWIRAGQVGDSPTDIRTINLESFYVVDAPIEVSLNVDQARIAAYVASLAKDVDQEGQDAALSIEDGRATVFRPSRNGIELDQPGAVAAIIGGLAKGSEGRTISLVTKIHKPNVNEENLNELGIKELLSEGISYFPASSSDRLTNVRVAQRLYNGLLIKPGEVFSFGEHLGEVGPAQGYRPSLVIIGNKEEKQYGGGICQVSSTLYRAALNAGLPIVQRTNHSFAVNEFYTKPYAAQGVDATIYYPQVDLKFKNDTNTYILVQTIMQGTTLRFQLYGTKVKSGNIRGPFIVSGSTDATQPSRTVFYRDVLDLSGNVIKTDTVNTFYKASTDFTIVDNKQFN